MKLKQLTLLLGITFLTAGYLVQLITFISAYRDEDKGVKVWINEYGEANFELGMLLISIPAVAFTFWWVTNQFKLESILKTPSKRKIEVVSK